jgi:hypothetical protein
MTSDEWGAIIRPETCGASPFLGSGLVIRISFVIRYSSFVIYFPSAPTNPGAATIGALWADSDAARSGDLKA